MAKEVKQKLTLDRPVTYQIKVPGTIDVSWADWAAELEVTFESEGSDPPVTILTGELDQAALHGLLRILPGLAANLCYQSWSAF